jgi:hypothetical protein
MHSGQTGAMASHTTGNPSATLAVIADHLERYHEQIGDLVPHYQLDEHGDMINALVEAERSLRTAARLVRKASKTAATSR